MKRLLLPLVILFMTSLAFAGIEEYYTFNATTGTYTPITGTDAGISSNDVISSAIPIGFTFPYEDYLYNEVKISSNGWIGLGTSQTSSNLTNNLTSTTIVPVIAPLWDDCSLAAGSCQYLLSGTAPNRIFNIQYSNLKWNYNSTTMFNLQVRLYESGKIDFVYGSAGGTPYNPSASIGINMLPGGSGWFYSVTPGPPASASTTTENNGVAVWPGQGTIYEFNPVVAGPNDLAALSVTGNTTPTAGQSSNYFVTVRNRGTNPQSTYQVKLLLGTQEIASVNGTAIQPGEILTNTIPWTPSTAGLGILYGKVVLAGDQNPNNDQTPPLNITVQPAGVQAVTIGAGDQTAIVPMDFYWQNSLFECLYYPDELGFVSGTITSLAFYNNFDVAPSNGATKIWLGSTNLADLSAGWIPSTQLTLVFDGNVTYPAGTNTITIPLQTPYMHTPGNLVMMVQRPMDTQHYFLTGYFLYFLAQTVGSTRARNVSSNGTTYDPANPPASATVSGQFPKTTIFYSGQALVNDLRCLSVSGNNTPTAGTSYNYVITIKNNGTAVQNNYTVKLMKEGGIQLNSVAGPTINSLQTLQITIPWTPPTAGSTYIYGEVVFSDDEIPSNNQSQHLNIVIQPAGIQAVTIGTGDQQTRIPMDFYYKSSLFECLYYPDELGFVSGTITSVAFYNNFADSPANGATKIWLGSTNQVDLSSGWIPSSQMTLVFDGNIVYPYGVNAITIPLQTPYTHIPGNLVMMVQRPLDTQYYSYSHYFYAQTVGTNRARKVQSDTIDYDPVNPPASATVSGQFPKTTFFYEPLQPAIINLFEPVQILMNSSENYLNLLNYFNDPYHISNYSITGNQHINYTINENGIMNLIPEQDWFVIEYLTIRSSYQSSYCVEQTLKVTVIQTWDTQEYFNNEGIIPSGWNPQHIGTTSFPWQAVQLEGTNYAMKTTATTGGTANERLLSPVYNLSNYKDIQVSFDSDFLPYGSGTGSFAYTLNDLTYTVVETYTTSHSGMRTYTIPAIDAKPTVRFRWLYSNSTANTGQNNYWIIDNFKIFGIVKDTQAPEVVTGLSIVSQDNHSALLSWNPGSDLYFDRYEIYISSDENVTTTDRLWSVNEDHNLYFVSTTQTRINPLTEGEYWIAIRAVDRDNNATPLSESVYVKIDATSPTFSNPLPSGQPEPEWSNSRIVTIGCQINDFNNIDLNSIKYRIDTNGNGIYDADEIWQALPPAKIMDRTRATINISVNVEYSSEGIFAFEFQATDIYDNTGYSGTNGIEGIEDDWVVRIDYPPAPINNFFVQDVYSNAILLSWTASSDLNFAGYRIYYSTSPEVSDTDMLWDSSNDPQLAFAGEGIISTTITGLLPATRYYFILQAFDEVGHITQYPQVITAMTSSSAIPMTPQNLVITVSGYDIMLNWDAVTLDTSQNPINISYYEVYVSDQPYFDCNIDNLLCTTETPGLLIEGGAEFADRLFFKIKAVSGAITKKNKVLPQKK